ncbi:hypothetical protein OHB56_02465 [Streptomyces sp. NBC_01635]|uniref:hypothetical protein n=1 Tax=Streptomyces sp. NBC_01635 TaxID=2975904 RepID=UPI00386BC9D1|nr:hypothetical protein OHB56_02465 [Streptomyces sp. NBC_01635]
MRDCSPVASPSRQRISGTANGALLLPLTTLWRITRREGRGTDGGRRHTGRPSGVGAVGAASRRSMRSW